MQSRKKGAKLSEKYVKNGPVYLKIYTQVEGLKGKMRIIRKVNIAISTA